MFHLRLTQKFIALIMSFLIFFSSISPVLAIENNEENILNISSSTEKNELELQPEEQIFFSTSTEQIVEDVSSPTILTEMDSSLTSTIQEIENFEISTTSLNFPLDKIDFLKTIFSNVIEKVLEVKDSIFEKKEIKESEKIDEKNIEKKEFADDLFKPVDAFTDIADLGLGRKILKIYNKPRLIENKGNGEKNISSFNKNFIHQTKEKKSAPKTYDYSAKLNNNDSVLVKLNNMEVAGRLTFFPNKKDVEEKQDDTSQETIYHNAYQNIDISWKNSGTTRRKTITINEPIKNIVFQDKIIFWEEYFLPESAKVFSGNEEELTAGESETNSRILIKLPDQTTLIIGSAIVFDAKYNYENDQNDPESVKQIIKFDPENNYLKVGLTLSGDYLLSKERQYPVTIDPDYQICKENDSDLPCTLVDYFISADNGGLPVNGATIFDSDVLRTGYYQELDRNRTYHPILGFNFSFEQFQAGQINSASLNLFLRSSFAVTNNYLDLTAKRITAFWERMEPQGDYPFFKENLQSENSVRQVNRNEIGNWISFDIKNSVDYWKNNGHNHGLLLEQSPNWPNGNTPPASWKKLVLVFDSQENSGTDGNGRGTSPYLQINYQAPGQPDLIINNTAINVASASFGDTVLANMSIINIGNQHAGAFEFGYYLSRDQYFDRGIDIPLFLGNQIGGLDPNNSIDHEANLIIPEDQNYLGLNYILFVADDEDGVLEADENNNVAYQTIAIDNRGSVDLQIRNVIAEQNQYYIGEPINFSVESRNLGDRASVVRISARAWIRNIADNSIYDLINLMPDTIYNINDSYQTFDFLAVTPNNLPLIGNYRLYVELTHPEEENQNNNLAFSATNIRIEKQDIGGVAGQPVPDTDSDGVMDSPEFIDGTDPQKSNDLHLINNPNYKNSTKIALDINNGHSVGDPVNARDGSFEFSQTDFKLSTKGKQIEFTRTYNSRTYEKNSRLGFGWTHNYNSYYYQNLEDLSVHIYLGGNLVSKFFTNDNGQTFYGDKGETGSFYNSNGIFIYETIDGDHYTFSKEIIDQMSMLTEISDTNGNRISLSYTNQRGIELLTSVIDVATGYGLEIGYGSERTELWDKIVSVRDNREVLPEERFFVYRYSGEQPYLNVISNTRFLNGQWSGSEGKIYNYDNSNLLVEYWQINTALFNEYDNLGRVIRQREWDYQKDGGNSNNPNGRLIYEFIYDDDGDPIAPNSTHCTLVKNYRDANNHYDDYTCFNEQEQKIYHRAGNIIESWEYNEDGMVSSFTDGVGNIFNYTYDNLRRLIRENLPNINNLNTTIDYEYWDNPNRLRRKIENAVNLVNPALNISKITNYEVDGQGNVTKIIYPDNFQERFFYNPDGNLNTKINKLNVTTTYTYDNLGYPQSETVNIIQPDGQNHNIVKNFIYDIFGRNIQYTDPKGKIYSYVYDSFDDLRQENGPLGKNKIYDWGKNKDRKIRETNELGQVTNYFYDDDLNSSLLKIEKIGQNNNNIVFRRQYDWLGNLTAEIDARGNTTTYNYDSANRIIQKINFADTINYVYDNAGRIIEETGSIHHIQNIYDARGNLIEKKSYIDANNFVSQINEYDGFNRVIHSIDGNGNITNYEYDLNDKITKIINSSGDTIQYFYDSLGQKIGELNPRSYIDENLRNRFGHSNTYIYDSLGRKIKEINAENKETWYFYDDNNNLIQQIDRQNQDGTLNNHAVSYSYDDLNRKISETDALGNSENYTYDVYGNLLSKINRVGLMWRYIYDDFNRLIIEVDPGNNTTTYSYDLNSNKTRITYPDNTQTNYTYDELNRLTRVTDALGNFSIFTYDSIGNKLTETDKNNNTTIFVYDKLSRLIRETNPQNTVTTYTYDNNNNRLTENVSGKITSYDYDELNRLEVIIYPGNKTESYTYDKNNNKVSYTNGNNQTITFVYDKLDRLTTKHLPDNNGFDVLYTYDNWNNLVNLVDQSGTTNYVYDLLNRLTTETKTIVGVADSKTISKEYYRDNQLSSITDVNNREILYNYNNRGFLNTVQYEETVLASYNYNSLGKPNSVVFGNGVNTTYSYDTLNRTSRIETRKNDQTLLFSQTYNYDPESNRIEMVETRLSAEGEFNTATTTYDYDSLNQLTDVDYTDINNIGNDLSYDYDSFGNRTSLLSPFENASYSYNNGTNELSTISYNNNRLNVLSEYNGQGSLTKETYNRLGITTKEINYNWTSENRLSSITYHDTSRPAFLPALSDNTLSFVYDDFGNRIKKQSAINNQQSEIVYYINDGLTVLNELDSAGTVSKTMVRGLEQLAEIDRNNVITYIHTDILGSTVLTTNELGNIVSQYEYTPFGELATAESNGINNNDYDLGYDGNSYLFTGQEYDLESELYYYNARYYNPRIGRFVSRDVVLDKDGDLLSRNLYIYVKNNPLKYTDPTGGVPDAQLAVLKETEEEFKLYVENGDWSAGLKSLEGHTFLEMRGYIFSWGPGDGDIQDMDRYAFFFNYGKEEAKSSFVIDPVDLLVTQKNPPSYIPSYMGQEHKLISFFDIYTFKVKNDSIEKMLNYYKKLGEANNNYYGEYREETIGRRRFGLSAYLFDNCTDVVVEALQAGDIIKKKIDTFRPADIKKELDIKYDSQNRMVRPYELITKSIIKNFNYNISSRERILGKNL